MKRFLFVLTIFIVSFGFNVAVATENEVIIDDNILLVESTFIIGT